MLTAGSPDTAGGFCGHRMGAVGQRMLNGSTWAVSPLGSYRLGAAGICRLPASGSGTGVTGIGAVWGAGGVFGGSSKAGGASNDVPPSAGT